MSNSFLSWLRQKGYEVPESATTDDIVNAAIELQGMEQRGEPLPKTLNWS